MQARDGFLGSMENADILKDVAEGSLKNACRYDVCYVNGCRFHTISHTSKTKSTENSEVCIKSDDNSPDKKDFYGKLEEIIELEYRTLLIKRVTLFKCQWYDQNTTSWPWYANPSTVQSWLMFILVDRIESMILLCWQVKLPKFIITLSEFKAKHEKMASCLQSQIEAFRGKCFPIGREITRFFGK